MLTNASEVNDVSKDIEEKRKEQQGKKKGQVRTKLPKVRPIIKLTTGKGKRLVMAEGKHHKGETQPELVLSALARAASSLKHTTAERHNCGFEDTVRQKSTLNSKSNKRG